MARRIVLSEAVAENLPVLFDTNILIREFNSGNPQTIRTVATRNRHTSVVSLWEFLRGTGGALLPVTLRRDRNAWLHELEIERTEISRPGSKTFATLVSKDAAPPDMEDCLIAADALARGWAVATSNVQDFEMIDGLVLVPV